MIILKGNKICLITKEIGYSPFPLLGPAVFLYSSAGMVDMGVGTVSISRCSWWGKAEALARAGDAASSSYSTSEQP